MKNIVLIGMPGSGKSTVGVVLAKMLGLHFLDSDLVIQETEGKLLSEIIEEKGPDGFLAVEDRVNADLQCEKTVIATGGSAVLRESSMKHLAENGVFVYLSLPYSVIARRVGNRSTRGIAAENNETLKDIYDFRKPYYERYADFTVDCKGNSVEKNVAEILRVMLGMEK